MVDVPIQGMTSVEKKNITAITYLEESQRTGSSLKNKKNNTTQEDDILRKLYLMSAIAKKDENGNFCDDQKASAMASVAMLVFQLVNFLHETYQELYEENKLNQQTLISKMIDTINSENMHNSHESCENCAYARQRSVIDKL